MRGKEENNMKTSQNISLPIFKPPFLHAGGQISNVNDVVIGAWGGGGGVGGWGGGGGGGGGGVEPLGQSAYLSAQKLYILGIHICMRSLAVLYSDKISS